MLAFGGPVSAGDRSFDVSQGGVDQFEGCRLRRGWAGAGDDDAARASRLVRANASIDRLQKLPTRRSFRRLGLPSVVVSAAATNGVLPGAPRPRLPPVHSPPTYASSMSISPVSCLAPRRGSVLKTRRRGKHAATAKKDNVLSNDS